jgi:hypothetical protein
MDALNDLLKFAVFPIQSVSFYPKPPALRFASNRI